jgi:hypothetical protein
MCKLLDTFSDGVIYGHDHSITTTMSSVDFTHLHFEFSTLVWAGHLLTHATLYANITHDASEMNAIFVPNFTTIIRLISTTVRTAILSKFFITKTPKREI